MSLGGRHRILPELREDLGLQFDRDRPLNAPKLDANDGIVNMSRRIRDLRHIAMSPVFGRAIKPR
jgi:hypothetical protein